MLIVGIICDDPTSVLGIFLNYYFAQNVDKSVLGNSQIFDNSDWYYFPNGGNPENAKYPITGTVVGIINGSKYGLKDGIDESHKSIYLIMCGVDEDCTLDNNVSISSGLSEWFTGIV